MLVEKVFTTICLYLLVDFVLLSNTTCAIAYVNTRALSTIVPLQHD